MTMNDTLHIIEDALINSVQISGLVLVMMMMIESLNRNSNGTFFKDIRKNKKAGVLLSAALGAIPGCLGGFATVSLYSKHIVSFGALVAMMIASSGDEAFVMMATTPRAALVTSVILFGVGTVIGLAVDQFMKQHDIHPGKSSTLHAHHHCDKDCPGSTARNISVKRVTLFCAVLAFIIYLVGGIFGFGHNHSAASEVAGMNLDLFDEAWMNVVFGILSIYVLVTIVKASDHFIDEGLWKHVVVRHLPSIFLWTFGILTGLGLVMAHYDISAWISDNTELMILLAAAIGLIPESGPHLVFVTLFASGVIPFPVLLASCISQDGHASLPLFAENKKAFLVAKAINFIAALAVGFIGTLFV